MPGDNLGILARVPLASGLLSGKYRPGATFPANDWRSTFEAEKMRKDLAEVERIRQSEVPARRADGAVGIGVVPEEPGGFSRHPRLQGPGASRRQRWRGRTAARIQRPPAQGGSVQATSCIGRFGRGQGASFGFQTPHHVFDYLTQLSVKPHGEGPRAALR